MAKEPCVYILASGKRGYIYIGVTSDMAARYHQHQEGTFEGFAKRRNCKRLVHIEMFATMDEAITREKHLKNWHRDWKINLVEGDNPDWRDLGPEMGLQ
ncbi:GIY-YIG nuclease family protein [uncultured Erythrobacter sp.]|uniref:GIY-YIG nuclease family protein n=1 Tax=uncultured Erythrobacter sp. TaxID=263913 RepID=UPI002618F477|nr:GIY-YIG nuclease family protein [uncultured Erythrobacter sp.]